MKIMYLFTDVRKFMASFRGVEWIIGIAWNGLLPLDTTLNNVKDNQSIKNMIVVCFQQKIYLSFWCQLYRKDSHFFMRTSSVY